MQKAKGKKQKAKDLGGLGPGPDPASPHAHVLRNPVLIYCIDVTLMIYRYTGI